MPEQKEIRVSYLISTRNRAEFLDQALQNIREFITPDDELIIMDGASTDNTPQIVEKHRDIVTLFRSEPDYGEAHGFNKGMMVSRGRYVKVLTDDDYFYPDAMKEAIAIMEQHPELDAVQCGGEAYQYDPETGQMQLVEYLSLPSQRTMKSSVTNIFYFVACGLGLILTRRAISAVGLFDTTYRAVDTDYMSRLIGSRADFRYLNLKLYRHVAYPHSGQNNWPVARHDRLRAALYNKAWNEVMNTQVYPIWAVSEVLGLSHLRGGNLLVELITHADRLRNSNPIYLKILNRIARGMVRGRRMVRQVRSLGKYSPSGTGLDLTLRTIEPKWDGSMR